MFDRSIVIAVICLACLGSSGTARADDEGPLPAVSEPSDEVPAPAADARASVELSLSVSPQLLLGRLLPGVVGLSGIGGLVGGTGGLGNLGDPSFPLILDVGFALSDESFLVVGLGGGFFEADGMSSYRVSVPLSVLVYLETPRVGRVLPTLRIGGVFGWSEADSGAAHQALVSASLLARGGVTWMAERWLALRAEVGLNGGVVSTVIGQNLTSGSVGFEASLALVLRI